jgi:hypothetical protein
MYGTIQSEGRHALLETMLPEQRTRPRSASALLRPADSRTGPRVASLTSCSLPWNEVDHGGHFAASEQPALFVEELRKAFRQFRKASG